MILLDILELYSENDKLTVVNRNDDFLDTYDGKNSINEKYNNCKVLMIYPLSNDTTVVMIDR